MEQLDHLVRMIMDSMKMERLNAVPIPVIEEIISQTLSVIDSNAGSTPCNRIFLLSRCFKCDKWTGLHVECDCDGYNGYLND